METYVSCIILYLWICDRSYVFNTLSCVLVPLSYIKGHNNLYFYKLSWIYLHNACTSIVSHPQPKIISVQPKTPTITYRSSDSRSPTCQDNTISMERVMLVYCIMKEITVNVGEKISDHILNWKIVLKGMSDIRKASLGGGERWSLDTIISLHLIITIHKTKEKSKCHKLS